jgi:ribosomal protein L4
LNAQLLVFEDLEVPTHKTKNIVNYVIEMENTKKLLVVDGGPINEKLKLATQNLHYVNLLPSIVSCGSILVPFHEFSEFGTDWLKFSQISSLGMQFDCSYLQGSSELQII